MTQEKELLIQKMRQQSVQSISPDTYATFEAYNSIIDSYNPDEITHLLYYKGILYFRTGDFNQALDYFNRCIHAPKSDALKRYDALSHNVIGLIHSYLNQEVIAKNEFSKCIRICRKYHLDYDLINIYINLGFLYFGLNNYIKAIEYEEIAFSLIDMNNPLHFQIMLICLGYQGLIHAKFGQQEKATDIYRQIERLQASHNDFYFDASIRSLAIQVAYYQKDENKLQEHLTLFLEFVTAKEDFLLSSEFYFDMCDVLLRLKRQTEVRRILDYITSYAKDFPQAFLRFYLQRLEVAYAKIFCSEDVYLDKVSQLIDFLAVYEAEQLSAQNYSLEHMEHIHQTKSLSSQLEEKSKLDPMTNLLNKYTIQFLIEEYLEDMEETNTSALLIVDMDHFKQINDTFGHLIGDAILTETASHIQHYFKEDSLCGRTGGDEFIIFVKNVYDTSSIILQAELLRQKIYGTVTERNISITTQASIGIAFTSDSLTTYETLFAAADKALYQAKKDGRNQTAVFE